MPMVTCFSEPPDPEPPSPSSSSPQAGMTNASAQAASTAASFLMTSNLLGFLALAGSLLPPSRQHYDDDDQSLQDLLPEALDSVEVEEVVDQRQDDDAEEGADNAAPSSR